MRIFGSFQVFLDPVRGDQYIGPRVAALADAFSYVDLWDVILLIVIRLRMRGRRLRSQGKHRKVCCTRVHGRVQGRVRVQNSSFSAAVMVLGGTHHAGGFHFARDPCGKRIQRRAGPQRLSPTPAGCVAPLVCKETRERLLTQLNQQEGGRWRRSQRRNGTEIDYKDWGTGQPIVFSHGWPLTADAWDAQMLFFGAHGYRVIAHDRRGHGRSSQTWDGNEMTLTGRFLGAIECLDSRTPLWLDTPPAVVRSLAIWGRRWHHPCCQRRC